MSIFNKKVLAIIVYYTLIALAMVSAGFFVYCLVVKDVALWAKIIYYVWTGFVVGNLIFDIICTNTHEGKTISGFIVYVLSVLAVVMACILYVINAGRTGLAVDFFNLFISVSLISLMTTGYMIASWCVGESIVEHATAQDEMQAKRKQAENK